MVCARKRLPRRKRAEGDTKEKKSHMDKEQRAMQFLGLQAECEAVFLHYPAGQLVARNDCLDR